jgi:phosphoglycerate dehydrogenase-like enzyme
MSTPRRLLVWDEHAAFHARKLRDAVGDAFEIQATTDREEARRMLAGQQALVVPDTWLDDEFLAAGADLAWVHSLRSGVDRLLASRTLPRDAVITSSRGIHGPQVAEAAILLMLALARRLPRMLKNQEQARWEPWPQPLLQGKHVVIVGVGSIAQALAPRCKAFGMRVTGVASRAREVAGFDAIRTRGELRALLPTADFVVLLVPLDDGSRGLFDAGMLAALPARAILVNLSRGGVVDEQALLAALRAGRLAGAGMDVFATEPLPASDPLWHAPNVIVTPHVGGQSETYAQQALVPLLANARAVARGDWDALVNRLR